MELVLCDLVELSQLLASELLLIHSLIHDHLLAGFGLVDYLVAQWQNNLIALVRIRNLILPVLQRPDSAASCQVLLRKDARLDEERIAIPLAKVKELIG